MMDDAGKALDDESQSGQSKRVVQRVQELVRKYVPPDRNLAEELIQERHKESAHK